MNEEEFLQQLQEESGIAPDPEAVQQEVTPQVRQAPAEIDMSGRGEGMQAFSSQPLTEMPELPAPTPEYTAVQEELEKEDGIITEAPLIKDLLLILVSSSEIFFKHQLFLRVLCWVPKSWLEYS